MTELERALLRHHQGTLPKKYYSRGGRLFPKSIMSSDSPDSCEQKDRKNMKEAKEKATGKIRNAPVVKDTVWYKPQYKPGNESGK